MPKLFSPVRLAQERKKKKLPDKVGQVKDVRDLSGDVIFVGTEAQWKKWARRNRTPLYSSRWSRRKKRRGS